MLELIVNPVAGNGLAKIIAKKVTGTLLQKGIPFRVFYTEYKGNATELARGAAERKAETVLALGGDGTVSEVAEGLVGTSTALGIIPCGTGNDFIKAAGIPAGWAEALEWCLSRPPRNVDCCRMNEKIFLNEGGTGFDVMTLDFAQHAKRKVRGIWPYLYGLLKAIFFFRPCELKLEIDGEGMEGKYMICAIGNGKYIGGGIPITPLAGLNDGLLQVLVVDAVPNWMIPRYLPSLMKGTLHKKKISHRIQARTVTIEMMGMRINLDGEILPIEKASFSCIKDALLLHW